MYEKNLQNINNESLKRRLMRVTDYESKQGISYCVTPSNDYVLLKDDIPIDDLNNPREAIRKTLEMNIKREMKSNDIIVVFGIGLGYILDEVFNTYPSKIYLYEPDINLLHFVLNNVDISEILASGRVFITNDMDELISKINNTFLTRDKVEIVYLQNYAVAKNKELLLLTQRVLDTCKSKIVDVNTIAKFSKVWLTNTLNNISNVNKYTTYLLADLENRFIGQTALILGAGPSLSDNIENIQKNRNHFVIFAVNKAIKYLQQNGVTPDFTICLDARNMQTTLDVPDEYLSRTNCIADIRTDSFAFTKPFSRVFVNFSDTDFLVQKISKYNERMKFLESGGTAAILGLVSAIKLGFSKVILAGVDLAFKDNVIYSDGRTIERVSPDEMMVDNVRKEIVQVKSVNGGNVFTRSDYAAFVHHFATIIKELNYSEIYNLSTFGAAIEGVKPVKFEDLRLITNATTQALNNVEPFKFDVQQFMQEEFYCINNIISLLSKEVFSPALVSAIVKSALVYQYMQSDVLSVLQKNFDPQVAEDFISETKAAIKTIVELLQRNKLI